MFISGMSGNEIFCLSKKGLEPGEIVVGNSVYSLGLSGALGAMGRSFAGGEITQITDLISEGRQQAGGAVVGILVLLFAMLSCLGTIFSILFVS